LRSEKYRRNRGTDLRRCNKCCSTEDGMNSFHLIERPNVKVTGGP
jgi:hypothetical protein